MGLAVVALESLHALSLVKRGLKVSVGLFRHRSKSVFPQVYTGPGHRRERSLLTTSIKAASVQGDLDGERPECKGEAAAAERPNAHLSASLDPQGQERTKMNRREEGGS